MVVVPVVVFAGEGDAPVDDGYRATVGAVAVWQERVVYPDALERFHDAQWRAW
jgi:hypothetical protein